MMNNLFIMFDPSTNIYSMNWLTFVFPLFFLIKNFWILKNRNEILNKMMLFLLIKDLKNNMKISMNNNMIIMMILFTMIYILNLMSIFPYIFAAMSHMAINFFLSFFLWFSLNMINIIYSFKKMLIHLVPANTPLFLCSFMVIIETISNVIRPLTLAIRLTANIIAGHILISLLSKMLEVNLLLFLMTIPILKILILLEMMVSIIQAYVFITLFSLYLNEI